MFQLSPGNHPDGWVAGAELLKVFASISMRHLCLVVVSFERYKAKTYDLTLSGEYDTNLSTELLCHSHFKGFVCVCVCVCVCVMSLIHI